MAPPAPLHMFQPAKRQQIQLKDAVAGLLATHREHVTLKVFCYLYALIQVSFNQMQLLVSIQISDLEGL